MSRSKKISDKEAAEAMVRSAGITKGADGFVKALTDSAASSDRVTKAIWDKSGDLTPAERLARIEHHWASSGGVNAGWIGAQDFLYLLHIARATVAECEEHGWCGCRLCKIVEGSDD